MSCSQITRVSTRSVVLLLVLAVLACFSATTTTATATATTTSTSTSTSSPSTTQQRDPLSEENIVTFASSLKAYGEQLSQTAQVILLQLGEHVEMSSELELDAEAAALSQLHEHERAWHKHKNAASSSMFPMGSFASRANAELSDELSKENLLRDEDGVPHLDNGAIDTHALLAELHQTHQTSAQAHAQAHAHASTHVHAHAHAHASAGDDSIIQAPSFTLTEEEKNDPALARLLAQEAELRSKLTRAHNLVETKKGAAFMPTDNWQDKLNRQKRIDFAKKKLIDPNSPLDEELLDKEIQKRKLVLEWKNKGIPFNDMKEIDKHISEARRLRAQAPPVMQPPTDGSEDPAAVADAAVAAAAATSHAGSASEVSGSGVVHAPTSLNGNERNLAIPVNTNMAPEAIRDLELSLQKHGADPFATIPGRAEKTIAPKEWTITNLMDPVRERCPNKCSGKGLCVMNLKETVTSTGGMNMHPYMCLCDAGYVGDACQIKLDMYLRYLLSEGAAPYPKCCKVCPSQMKAPMKFHDIPTFINPFSKISEGCRPLPYISTDSREATSIRVRRNANDKCVQPLSTFEPIIALELATTLSHAQHIMASPALAEALATPSANRTSQHINSLSAFAARLVHAGETAEAAAGRLIKRFANGASLTPKDPAARLNIGLIHDELRRLPPVSECCLFCDLTETQASEERARATGVSPDAKNNPHARKRVYGGVDSILNTPAQHDSVEEEVLRNFAITRRDRRHAKLRGLSDPDSRPCCVVCPFNFREGFAAQDLQEYKNRNNPVFVEVETQVGMEAEMFASTSTSTSTSTGRRGNEVLPCCNACPSQFLASHAFPAGPYDGERQPPIPSKATDKPANGAGGSASAPPAQDGQPIPTAPVIEAAVAQGAKGFF